MLYFFVPIVFASPASDLADELSALPQGRELTQQIRRELRNPSELERPFLRRAKVVARAMQLSPELAQGTRHMLLLQGMQGNREAKAIAVQILKGPVSATPLLRQAHLELGILPPEARNQLLDQWSKHFFDPKSIERIHAADAASKALTHDATLVERVDALARALDNAPPGQLHIRPHTLSKHLSELSADDRLQLLKRVREEVAGNNVAKVEAAIEVSRDLARGTPTADSLQRRLEEALLTGSADGLATKSVDPPPLESPEGDSRPARMAVGAFRSEVTGDFNLSRAFVANTRNDTYNRATREALKEAGVVVEKVEEEADRVLFGTVTRARDDTLSEGELHPVVLGLEIDIRWEVLDVARQEVVYESTTRVYKERNRDVPSTPGTDYVTASIADLVARPNFERITKVYEQPEFDSIPDSEWSDTLQLKRCEVEDRELPGAIEEVLPGIVVIQNGEGMGTGIVVSPDGFILTAAHVVDGDDDVEVRVRSGEAFDATVVRLDGYQDVAIVHIDATDLPCVGLSDGRAIGESTIAVGNPGKDLEYSLSRGIISGYRSWAGTRFIQTDASINPGFSGGPLLDNDGRAVGILSWKLAGDRLEGLGFAVPIDAALERLGTEAAEVSSEELDLLTGRIERWSPPELQLVLDDVRLRDTMLGSRKGMTAGQVLKADRTGFLIAGGIVTTAGLGLVLGGWGLQAGSQPISQTQYDLALATNTVGWSAVVSGALFTVITAGKFSRKL